MYDHQQKLLDEQTIKWQGSSIAKADDSTVDVKEVELTPLPTGWGYFQRIVTLKLSDDSVMYGCTVENCAAVFAKWRVGSMQHWESEHSDLIEPKPKRRTKAKVQEPEPTQDFPAVMDWTIADLLARAEEFERLIRANNRLTTVVTSLKTELTEARKLNASLQRQIDSLR
ncbi:MAG TPA: hypothetical protein VIY48_14040 [Candidatus Paceibacterota bacterium]